MSAPSGLRALTACFALAIIQAAPGQIILDAGTPSQFLFNTSQDPLIEQSMTGAGILGGERDIAMLNANSPNGLAIGVAPGSVHSDSVILEANRGSNRNATFMFTWDGVDGSHLLDHEGLGGLDLAATSTHLSFFLTKDAVVTDWTFEFYTDAGNYSSYLLSLSDNAIDNEYYSIPFSSFTDAAGTGADFSNIGAVRFINSSTDLASDTVIDNLQFTSVPEPSVPGLLVLALLPLLRRRR